MGRNVRNFIMITLLILTIGLTVLTVMHKDRVMNGGNTMQQQGPGMNGQQQGPGGQQQPNGQMQPPATPEGVPEGTTPPQPPGMEGQQPNGQMQGQGTIPGLQSEMPTYFYFLFGMEGLVISCLLFYLILSKFNRKSARSVFSTAGKKLTFAVLVLALTAGITFGCVNISLPKETPTAPMGPGGNSAPSVGYSSVVEVLQQSEKK